MKTLNLLVLLLTFGLLVSVASAERRVEVVVDKVTGGYSNKMVMSILLPVSFSDEDLSLLLKSPDKSIKTNYSCEEKGFIIKFEKKCSWTNSYVLDTENNVVLETGEGNSSTVYIFRFVLAILFLVYVLYRLERVGNRIRVPGYPN